MDGISCATTSQLHCPGQGLELQKADKTKNFPAVCPWMERATEF